MDHALPDHASPSSPQPGPGAAAAARLDVDTTAARILDVLAATPEPLGAYGVLRRLREHDRYDPPTVYRALSWLVRNQKVHRLETLKAYVARRFEPDARDRAVRDTSALFIVCDRCRSVSEIDDQGLGRLIGRRTTAAMFVPRAGTIEVLGTCARCRDGGTGRDRSTAGRRGSARAGTAS